ncbi:hypothetical protein B0J17DRAFT_633560 [Rhizoctonia solani]|nr:hypothetical protein B0J17DRAFT_633560 [Rhizoctonia solani]
MFWGCVMELVQRRKLLMVSIKLRSTSCIEQLSYASNKANRVCVVFGLDKMRAGGKLKRSIRARAEKVFKLKLARPSVERQRSGRKNGSRTILGSKREVVPTTLLLRLVRLRNLVATLSCPPTSLNSANQERGCSTLLWDITGALINSFANSVDPATDSHVRGGLGGPEGMSLVAGNEVAVDRNCSSAETRDCVDTLVKKLCVCIWIGGSEALLVPTKWEREGTRARLKGSEWGGIEGQDIATGLAGHVMPILEAHPKDTRRSRVTKLTEGGACGRSHCEETAPNVRNPGVQLLDLAPTPLTTNLVLKNDGYHAAGV